MTKRPKYKLQSSSKCYLIFIPFQNEMQKAHDDYKQTLQEEH